MIITKFNGSGWELYSQPVNYKYKIVNGFAEPTEGEVLGYGVTTSVPLHDWLDDNVPQVGDLCLANPVEGFVPGGSNTHWYYTYVRPI